MQFNQQQQPSMFPFLDEFEHHVHPVTGPALAGIGAVGGYFFGREHPSWPLVVFVALGLIFGLLAVVILKNLTAFVIGATIVAAATLAAFWLLKNDAALKTRDRIEATPMFNVQPSKSGSLIDELKGAVRR